MKKTKFFFCFHLFQLHNKMVFPKMAPPECIMANYHSPHLPHYKEALDKIFCWSNRIFDQGKLYQKQNAIDAVKDYILLHQI